MLSEIALSAEDLTKVYESGLFKKRSVTAVDDVTFQIRKGQISSLVGESGSGKTTVAKIILKLIRPTAGRILYRGEDISDFEKGRDLSNYRRHVQGIFQDPYSSFNLFYKVDRVFNMMFRLFDEPVPKDERKLMVESSLKRVGLNPADILGRYPHQLSGGQRQRVLVARSLLVNPEILLADEPTSMIDASTRIDVLKVFTDLKERQGLSILFISHDLGLAYYISDRILVMRHGKIVEEGDAEEVIMNPKHDYTKNLLSAIPTLSKKWGDLS